MALETDLLIDRRRLKRRLLVWRVISVVAIVAVVGLAVSRNSFTGGGSYVARVRISGVIEDNRKLVEAIYAVAKEDRAKALIVEINSPGGGVGPSEALYFAITAVAAKKPVVAVMGGVAASGGYMAAVAAPRIYARESTITGSIGVIMSHTLLGDLMGKIGLTDETLTSGPLKDQPNSTRPMTEAGRAVLQALITDLYDQFVEKVVKGRSLEPAIVRTLADGRVYTGRQALRAKLIDAIGGTADAREWLASARDIAAGLPTEDIITLSPLEKLLGETREEFLGGLLKSLFSQRVKLDGAMALWQPFETN